MILLDACSLSNLTKHLFSFYDLDKLASFFTMAESFYGWVPPSADAALFVESNCAIAAQWLAASVNSLYNGTDDIDPPLIVTYQYISALIPNGGEVPTFGQAAQWFGEVTENSTLYEQMVQFPYNDCPDQICEKLVWEGDGDLAGVGVMVVYYLAAAFATMYFVLLAADQFEPFQAFEHHHRRWNWVVGAFHETVNSFLDTGLIFCIAMLISGVYRHGSARLHPDKSHSIYQLTNATYIGIFSIFPPLLLQIIAPNKRRRRIRATLWFLVIVMAVVMIALYFSLETSATKVLDLLDRQSAISDLIWELNCEPADLRDSLDIAIMTACAILILNFFPWFYHTLVPRKSRHRVREASVVGRLDAVKPGRHGRSWWKHMLSIARTIDGAACCIIMWALLALYTAYRGAVLDKMGEENSNSEWSFAQVFALATWVPVAIDLATIYIYGAKAGIEGKVSDNFKVVENNRKGSDGDGPSDVDYANLDPFQVIPAQQTTANNGQYGAVNNGTPMQYVGSGSPFSDGQYNNGQLNNNGQFNNNNGNMAHYGGDTSYDSAQYGAGGAGNSGQFTPQYAPQYTPQYDPSMAKEAAAEAQPMAQYMQPAPYNSNTVSTVHTNTTGGSGQSIQPVSYEHMPQDPAAMHGGEQQ